VTSLVLIEAKSQIAWTTKDNAAYLWNVWEDRVAYLAPQASTISLLQEYFSGLLLTPSEILHWDPASENAQRILELAAYTTHFSVPNYNLLFLARRSDNAILFVKLDAGAPVSRAMLRHAATVVCLGFESSRRILASLDDQFVINMWNMDEGSLV
jgi:hypothetical protein